MALSRKSKVPPVRFAQALFLGLLLGVLSVLSVPAPVNPVSKEFKIVTVAEDLDQPWGLAFLPDGTMLVTEKIGRLRLIGVGGLDPRPIEGLPEIFPQGQGGLLDVVLHPDYPRNQWIYLSYSGGSPGLTGTEVLRARLNLKDYRLDDVKIIFKMQPKLDANHHFGSRLLFDDKGYLFITLGERGQMQESQNLGSHQGKVVRLHDDGTVPKDNPFVGVAGALPEIYTYGHRNVQGIAMHPVTRQIWTHEHGPRGGDEVNILKPGANYGWPVITYGINYDGSTITTETHREGMEQPVLFWVPSIAPCGMMFYTGNKFPAWKGNLFVGALGKMHLRRVVFDNKGRPVDGQELLLELRERIRNVRQGPDGSIYILTDSRNGSVLRLE